MSSFVNNLSKKFFYLKKIKEINEVIESNIQSYEMYINNYSKHLSIPILINLKNKFIKTSRKKENLIFTTKKNSFAYVALFYLKEKLKLSKIFKKNLLENDHLFYLLNLSRKNVLDIEYSFNELIINAVNKYTINKCFQNNISLVEFFNKNYEKEIDNFEKKYKFALKEYIKHKKYFKENFTGIIKNDFKENYHLRIFSEILIKVYINLNNEELNIKQIYTKKKYESVSDICNTSNILNIAKIPENKIDTKSFSSEKKDDYSYNDNSNEMYTNSMLNVILFSAV